MSIDLVKQWLAWPDTYMTCFDYFKFYVALVHLSILPIQSMIHLCNILKQFCCLVNLCEGGYIGVYGNTECYNNVFLCFSICVATWQEFTV